MRTKIGLNDEQRIGVARILHMLMADEVLLATRTRKFHWNVTGPHFGPLHAFFAGQYKQLDALIDEIAERSLALGVRAPGTLNEFLNLARLKETPDERGDAQRLVQALLFDHEALIRHVRADIEIVGATWQDIGTADFLTDVLSTHEKMAWMLRAHDE